MKFEFDNDDLQDIIATYGKDHAIEQMTSSFAAALESTINEINVRTLLREISLAEELKDSDG
jgi:hypothetical protein